MKTPSPSTATLERLANQIQMAAELTGRGEPAQAVTTLERVIAEAKRHGLTAPDAEWALCIALDNLNDLPGAFAHIQKALAFDPLSPSYRRSFHVLVNRVKEALLSEDRPPFDPEVPKFYELLQGANVADVLCHVRFGAFLVATKRYDEAKEHLLAAAQLAPHATEAWVLLSQVAMATDDEVLASHVSSMVTEPPDSEPQGTFPQFTAAAG